MRALAFLLLFPFAIPAFGEAPEDEAPPVEAEPAPAIIKTPRVVDFVDAPYPPAAKAEGLSAVVGLVIEIDETGEVLNAIVQTPAGHGFDDAALQAARQMRFSPAETAEGPIAVAIAFDYHFTLEPERPEPDALPPNLTGTVREMGSRRPLAGITVTALSGQWTATAVTGEDGRFFIRDAPLGPVNIAADTPGYKATSRFVKIGADEAVELTLWLRNTGNWNEEMVVLSEKPEEHIVRRTITVEEIKRIPGTFGDPVRVIQNLPGTARAPFGSGMVVVRGSNPEDTAFYVDGIRVPLIYHLGGFVSIINDDMVGSVDYLPGGYGVEYGRSGGGVININTNQDYPERFRAEWSTDLLDSGGVLQGRFGPEGRWGLTAAGRRSYIDVFIPLFTKDTGFTVKPYWWDYQVKIDDLGRDNGRLTVLAMGFGDKLYFGTPDSVAQGTDQDTQGDADISYGAHRLIVQYAHEFGDDWTVRLTPSIGVDVIEFTLGNEWRFSNKTWISELRGDVLWETSPHLTLRGGIDFLGGPYDVRLELPIGPETFAETDPLVEREDSTTVFEGSFWSPDPFVEAHWRPLDDPDDLLIIPGLRLNTIMFPYYSRTSLDPRVAVRVKPFERSTLKGGTGLYHQPPQGPDLGFDEQNVRVDFERTWSSEVGWEQEFTDAIEADITVFHKELEDLIVENEDYDSIDDALLVNAGTGRVQGMEILLRHNPANRFFGWISYTLSRAERLDVPTDSRGHSRPNSADDWRPFEFDQTHILVALAGYELPLGWGVSARYRYTTGNPYTPFSGGIYDVDHDSYYPYSTGEAMSDRLPAFQALDLRVDKRYTFKWWWLETYLDLINVVRGENPEFIQYNYDYTETAYVRGLPFIASPGIRAEFLF